MVPDIQVTQEKGVLDLNPRSDPMEYIGPERLEPTPLGFPKVQCKKLLLKNESHAGARLKNRIDKNK